MTEDMSNMYNEDSSDGGDYLPHSNNLRSLSRIRRQWYNDNETPLHIPNRCPRGLNSRILRIYGTDLLNPHLSQINNPVEPKPTVTNQGTQCENTYSPLEAVNILLESLVPKNPMELCFIMMLIMLVAVGLMIYLIHH
ncbi:hypothetical protein KR093_010822 [Drosophila rubida]|uniref:Uncharacterized protein n=1 Tax=Drosophila rubida TaxID=30044 RepID=A0AAD4PQW0_9MUSC|nr:hypothetical protein KR093_010822 [Drosophila rubida]